jgi:pimeloyl-ACP methyl ester carboxylesterase
VESLTSVDGTRIAYLIEGDGDPVLMLHGFASDSFRNWIRTGIAGSLRNAGYQTIVFDARGHGRSDKPYEPHAYEGGAMRRDAQALLDHLGVNQVRLLGYSMGARVGVALLRQDPRVRSAVLGGIGHNFFRKQPNRERIADALVAEDLSGFEASPLAFRTFAEATRADRLALSAAMRSGAGSEKISDDDLRRIDKPVLVICGDRDTLAGPPSELANLMGTAEPLVVSGDHLTAVGDPRFVNSIIEFFGKN